MRKLILNKRAERAFIEITEYITENSGSTITARRYIDKLYAKCLKFARLKSQLGRARPELGDGIRSFAYENYIIYMRYTTSSLEIITILSHARDVEDGFEGDGA